MASNQEVMDDFTKNFPTLNYGEPQEVGGAIIIPILEDTNIERDYISFEEALKANLLKFVDTGNINEVIVENLGDKDILIFAGQIVSSQGSQDRVFAETVFLTAYQKVKITCNCCEASKPIYRGTKFIGSSYSPRRIKYCSIMTDIGHYERQSKIWNKVNSHRIKLKKSGAYMAEDTDKLEAIIEETKRNTKGLLKNAKLLNDQRGVIILNNEAKVVGLEIFDSPETYKSIHEKIIESYLEDIITEKKKKLPKNPKDILQNELRELFAKQISVEENSYRTLIRNTSAKLNGEVIFRKGKKKKSRVVMFRMGSQE
ncbi:MAG: ARPP-1 family domain-containing protein [Candidatus Helarchaeota archaeon]